MQKGCNAEGIQCKRDTMQKGAGAEEEIFFVVAGALPVEVLCFYMRPRPTPFCLCDSLCVCVSMGMCVCVCACVCIASSVSKNRQKTVFL